ncbi:hypothetical protein P12x_003737 [Tundrisphaera lichenicola]|uniref:hypothetical protein n=1 Tax=Tundrisphaera lichenicola TaxID=2029860 RepID=UPI003EC13BDA
MKVPRALTTIVLASASMATFLAWPTRADRPLHERETEAAWKAFVSGQYMLAIEHADRCIKEFRGTANRKQAELKKGRTKVPNGIVSDALKKQIHGNGPLNDVATSYYIKGRAWDRLSDKGKTQVALLEAIKYPDARSWDAKGGWFWAPAEAAEDYLTNPEWADKPPHEIYTAKAWAAYVSDKFPAAALFSNRCIVEFQSGATAMQKSLLAQGAVLPIGEANEEEKRQIARNGLLNDVATCLFINGRASEELGDKEASQKMYEQGKKMSLGRCWDPQGWYWSPAQACAEHP